MAANVSGDADGPSDLSACGEDSFSTEITENNTTQINVKKNNSILKSFRKRLKPSPLSQKNKDANNTIEKKNIGNDLGYSSDYTVQSPASPSKYHISKVLEYIFLVFVLKQIVFLSKGLAILII